MGERDTVARREGEGEGGGGEEGGRGRGRGRLVEGLSETKQDQNKNFKSLFLEH